MWQVFEAELETMNLKLNFLASVVLEDFLGGKEFLNIIFIYLRQLRNHGIEYKSGMEFKDKIILQNMLKTMVENLRTTVMVIIKRIFEC